MSHHLRNSKGFKSSVLGRESKTTLLFSYKVLVTNPYPLFTTPWTVVCQAPLFMGFPGQEYGSGLPFSSSGNLPDPGIKLLSPSLQAESLPLSHPGSPKTTYIFLYYKSQHHRWKYKSEINKMCLKFSDWSLLPFRNRENSKSSEGTHCWMTSHLKKEKEDQEQKEKLF